LDLFYCCSLRVVTFRIRATINTINPSSKNMLNVVAIQSNNIDAIALIKDSPH
jgi:hypothetical protein